MRQTVAARVTPRPDMPRSRKSSPTPKKTRAQAPSSTQAGNSRADPDDHTASRHAMRTSSDADRSCATGKARVLTCPMSRRTAWLFCSALALSLGCASSSKQQRDKVEQARLALEREANRLVVVWEEADPVERVTMEEPLERVLAESGSDPRVAELRLLLASHYLEQRRRKDADRIIEPLLKGPEGPARDSAQILKAEGLTLEGHGEEALELLLPLSGKLVGESARSRHEKALVLAAIEARRWRLTILTMVDWLAEVRLS